jgi:hypothetical protein
MSVKTISLLFLIFQLSASSVFAQLDISGRVVDKDSKDFLVGVNIIIKNETLGTATDNSGFFRFIDR